VSWNFAQRLEKIQSTSRNNPRIFRGQEVFFFILQQLKIKEIHKNRNRPGMNPNSVGSLIKIWLILQGWFHVESTMFSWRNVRTPAARMSQASPAAPSLSHAGGQGPMAAPLEQETKPAGVVPTSRSVAWLCGLRDRARAQSPKGLGPSVPSACCLFGTLPSGQTEKPLEEQKVEFQL
jgi:hypothetical protein